MKKRENILYQGDIGEELERCLAAIVSDRFQCYCYYIIVATVIA